MYKRYTILALIPARGKSKRLPRKNIKLLLGKSLISWTIEEAKKSKYIDSIVVSTEDPRIRRTALKSCAQAPFLRPGYLSGDNVKSMDVVLHAMDWFQRARQHHDLLLLLQPTSPLRKAEDIDKAIEYFFEKKAEVVVSVCKAEHNPMWTNRLPKSLRMDKFLRSQVKREKRQELPGFFRLNGAIYLAFWEYLRKHKTFFGSKTYAYIMPTERSVDIDTQFDFKLAEILLKQHG